MTTTRTYRLRGGEVERAWHVLDADSRPLGRLATEAASLLLGKHKPSYEPHLAMGDFVVVVNASRVAVTGRKSRQKIYYRHSGYPGGLRERTLEQQLSRDPCTVVERAVRGMLPHNSRGRELFRRLKVYAGPEHPHQAQLAAGTGERARRRRRSEETASSSAVEAVPATVDVESPAPAVEAVPEAAPEATSEAAPEATPEAASGAEAPSAAGRGPSSTPRRLGSASRSNRGGRSRM